MVTQHTLSCILVFACLAASAAHAQVFSEDFDQLGGGVEITTENTALTYVRVGSGGGSIESSLPSSFGGASAVITGPSSSSLNGIGIVNTLPAAEIYSMAFDLRLLNSEGRIVFGAGSGSSFSSNSAFNSGEGLFWFQLNAGITQFRSGDDWIDVDGGQLESGANYHFHIIANGSADPTAYGDRTLAAGTMDFYLNGSLILDQAAVTNLLAADGFRLYSVQNGTVEIDNIALWNAPVQPIPEPAASAAAMALAGLALAGGRCFRNRFHS